MARAARAAGIEFDFCSFKKVLRDGNVVEQIDGKIGDFITDLANVGGLTGNEIATELENM